MVTGESILVAGSTGNQGGAVARRLLDAGWRVRALTRSPDGEPAKALAAAGADAVQGDLDDRDSIERAVNGAYGVFSVQDYWEHGADREVSQGKTLADVAKEAGVTHFVYSSVGGADRGSGLSHFESKWEIENHVRAIGIPATIVRPVFLMENFDAPQYRPSILGGTLALGLLPDVKLQLVASEDVGAFVQLAFADPGALLGEAVELAGDELTGPELAGVLSGVIERPVRFVAAPLERIRAMKPEVAEMFDWENREGYKADLEALRRLLPDLLTFDAWLRRTGWTRRAAEGAPPIGEGRPSGP
jgi:uncharacterized protein YbjT (DUF2867 family)